MEITKNYTKTHEFMKFLQKLCGTCVGVKKPRRDRQSPPDWENPSNSLLKIDVFESGFQNSNFSVEFYIFIRKCIPRHELLSRRKCILNMKNNIWLASAPPENINKRLVLRYPAPWDTPQSSNWRQNQEFHVKSIISLKKAGIVCFQEIPCFPLNSAFPGHPPPTPSKT